MKNLMWALTIGTGLASVPLSLRAEKIDLNQLRCQQFLEIKKDTADVIIAWLQGYYAETDSPEIIDLEQAKQLADKITIFCRQNPKFTLAAVAAGMLAR